MKPWKLRVDWTVHDAYPNDPYAKVAVELHIMDENPRTLREFDTIPKAVDFAVQFFKGRGFGFWCDVDMHQRENHTHITMHPTRWYPRPVHLWPRSTLGEM